MDLVVWLKVAIAFIELPPTTVWVCDEVTVRHLILSDHFSTEITRRTN